MGGGSSQSVARLLAAAVLVLVAACSGGSGADGHRASPKASTPASSTPPPTIDLSTPIPGGSLHGTPRPPLENTGTDYVAIFKSLIANQRWISENPDPRLISDVYVPGTPGHDERVAAYQYLVANGYRWADEGYQLLSIDVISALPEAATLRAVQSLQYERVVDANGQQVGEVRPHTGEERLIFTLVPDSSGRWRIADAISSVDAEVRL